LFRCEEGVARGACATMVLGSWKYLLQSYTTLRCLITLQLCNSITTMEDL
jgi:hypothetical protein